MLRTGFSFILFFISSSLISEIFPQVPDQIQKYRAEPYGEFKYERESILDGNLIRTLFKNTGEIGHWPFQPSGEWPKGSGHPYLDGMTLLIGAEVTAPGNQAVIHPIETSYREEMDINPVTGEIWGLEPIPGYSNPSSTKPAMSIDQNSWPSIWPEALGLPLEYNGKFPSYFGLYASRRTALESFFVMDDSRDGEFLRPPYKYYPILSDTTRGGLGLRIETRFLQFSDVEVQNVLFMKYKITNISDYSYDKTCFGYFIDPGVGGPSSGADDIRYDKYLDLTYAWDYLGKGVPGNWTTGYVGFALLETTSNYLNGIDDDEDGMIDERQDDGIDNDHDWDVLVDDIGHDGVPNTNDQGEGDGLPTDGEPDFDKTDKDESDQLGLNSVSIFDLAHTTSTPWPKNDEVVWNAMVSGFKDTSITNTNVNVIFSTGPFSFPKFSSDSIAAAIICANDLDELEFMTTSAKQIYNNNFALGKITGIVSLSLISPKGKEKVSGILPIQYSLSNYVGSVRHQIFHFTPSTGWTFLAEGDSIDGLYNWQTNATNDGIFHRIAVFSYTVNGSYSAYSDFFTIQNDIVSKPEIYIVSPKPGGFLQSECMINFYAGTINGDSCTVNFYYKPTENSFGSLITSNLTEKDTMFAWNTISYGNSYHGQLIGEIISGPDTANYIVRDINLHNFRSYPKNNDYIIERKSIGTGDVELHIVDSSHIAGDDYLMVFDSTYNFGKPALYYKLYNKTKGNTFITDVFEVEKDRESPMFDGLMIVANNDSGSKEIKYPLTKWIAGNSNANLGIFSDLSSVAWKGKADYEIRFSNKIVDTTDLKEGRFVIIPINFEIFNITSNYKPKVAMADPDKSGSFSVGDEIRILEYEGTSIKTSWIINYQLSPNPIPPVAGDVFRIVAKKEFVKGDSITFTTSGLVGVRDRDVRPSSFSLSQNYPNPFNPVTKIQFSVPQNEVVKIKVYDFLGAEIATLVNREMNSGSYEVDFNGKTLASGIYFVRMEAGKFVETKKIVLLK